MVDTTGRCSIKKYIFISICLDENLYKGNNIKHFKTNIFKNKNEKINE